MELVFEILFWSCVAALFYTYVGFHILLEIWGRLVTRKRKKHSRTDNLPKVSVLLSVYNEEAVIVEKIKSTFDTDYPADKLEVIVGSDRSNDETNNLLKRMAEDEPRLQFVDFPNRQGKPAVINHLVSIASGDVLIMTDAKVYFKPYTIYELIKHFKADDVAIVGGNICSRQKKSEEGVAQEKMYMSREMRVKYLEGKIWGAVAGVFGACYAIRKEDFRPVPPRYLVDDYYITMKALSENRKVLQDLKAICTENVSPHIQEEFRRKIRIATGNFQNLRMFKDVLIKRNGVGFSIVSHKVLRWLGPFFLILMGLSLVLLAKTDIYRWFLYLYLVSFAAVSFDLILMKINKHFILLRFLTHFYVMNLALFIGFFKSLKGVKTSAWEPTKR
ncbi:glycosyltransferase [Prolixibacteraceae bacterium JC049]|nr:glycosyltransferase [Prolixibacteraceae bacterium JC049]